MCCISYAVEWLLTCIGKYMTRKSLFNLLALFTRFPLRLCSIHNARVGHAFAKAFTLVPEYDHAFKTMHILLIV